MTLQQHLNPFHRRKVSITSPLTVPEIVERLRADVAPWYVFWGVKQEMKGKVKENGVVLRRFTGARKTLSSEARGRFETDGRGTKLDLTIGWGRMDLVSLALALLIMVPVVWILTTDPKEGAPWAPYVFATIVAVSLGIQRAATFHDDDWLVARFCQLLQGTEVPGPY